MASPKPIIIQELNESEKWQTVGSVVHAIVNKSAGNAYLGSGSEQSSSSKTFTFRYCPTFSKIQFCKQNYRIIYEGYIYMIEDYDDYQESHINIRLLGVSRGVRAENTNK